MEHDADTQQIPAPQDGEPPQLTVQVTARHVTRPAHESLPAQPMRHCVLVHVIAPEHVAPSTQLTWHEVPPH